MILNIRKMGNSQGVILPKSLLGQIGAVDSLAVTVEKGNIILSCPTVRRGWAEAAAMLVETEQEHFFSKIENEADKEWIW
ncbi:TPA: growth regulator [Neisseria meningitidis]